MNTLPDLHQMQGAYFISGIDTDIGKTIVTGYIARRLLDSHQQVITQKLIQTGNAKISEDIEKHRRMMGVGMLPDDDARLTMPLVLSYPASPHLASRIDGIAVDTDHITACTKQLLARHDVVLIEGAGGLMVPLKDDTNDGLIIDYIQSQGYPVILVTSGRLGGINHTLLSLSTLKSYGIHLHALAYNQADDSSDKMIAADTKQYLQAYLKTHHSDALWWEIPRVDEHSFGLKHS